MSNRQATFVVASGPDTYRVQALASQDGGETELSLVVGGQVVAVRLENARVWAQGDLGERNTVNWTMKGTLVTNDERLVAVNLPSGSLLIVLYNSEQHTGAAW